jgi:hypothetical protein
MHGVFVTDRTRVGSAVVEQIVTKVVGPDIPTMRRDVAERVAARHGVPMEPILRRTRIGFLEGGQITHD